ncbi:MAG: dienelactone hydrolase family protein [Isosphaeraceae bacterium]|nr:dienelactone hydrolase family protein [Isosphaeraceae bacterium]
MPPAERPSWFDELQRAPASVPEAASRPIPLLFDAEHRPITTREAWAKRRDELSTHWRSFLGTISAPRAAPRCEVLEEDERDGVLRRLVRYEAEPGLPVEGYLLQPLTKGERRAGVVVLHSTVDHTIRQPAGLEGPADLHIGLHLARRGHVAFCPRCFLWQYGGPGLLGKAVEWLRGRHPGVTGMGKMLFDAVRAVDLLASQPGVDPRRLGAIGHSLGAKEALYLAAFDPRIRASVASEGGVGLSYSNWDAPWYLGPAVRRPGFPLDHGQVVGLAAPGALLIVGGDSADGAVSWPYVEAALPVWSLTGNPDGVGLYNHRRGHSFPAEAQERSYAWLEWFLPAASGTR